QGVIVGYAASEPFHPEAKGVRSSDDGTLILLETPSDEASFPHAIDNDGRIVGESGRVAFIAESGRADNLPMIEGAFSGAARALNGSGLIVGSYGDSDFMGPQHCIWPSKDEEPILLPGLFPDVTTGSAWDINEFGQIAGVTGGSSGVFFAVRWDSPDETPIQIGPLPGAMNSEGRALNEQGDVVGRSAFADFTIEAFFFDAEAEDLVPLGFLPGGEGYSEAFDVNDARLVVGVSRAPEGGVHAVLWEGTKIYDLNDLIVAKDPSVREVSVARAINEAGEIAVEVVLEGDNEEFAIFKRRIGLLVPVKEFRRGDANDDGNIDIADAVRTLTWLFAGAEEPGCRAAANTNGDGNVDIADPIHLLAYLFAGGPAPEPPHSECGPPSLPADVSIGCRTSPESCL
ncbi:MAG TPA: hypothetical protein VK116_08190, partial [Planctomycetota bacterium]|nr:hypothetical protein [Planctomycetota bacterium]